MKVNFYKCCIEKNTSKYQKGCPKTFYLIVDKNIYIFKIKSF